ncbi:MAG: glucuronyl esterase domain-containing protein [Agriterribacter sp.]
MNKKQMLVRYMAIVLLLMVANIFFAHAQQYVADTSYQLPNALITQAGKKIATTKEWEKLRRPEILALFENNVQGKTPATKIPLRFVIASVNQSALNGKAVRKQVTIHFGTAGKDSMDLLLYLPNNAAKPVPVFLGLNFGGNQVIHPDTGIIISKRWVRYTSEPAYVNHLGTEASRGTQSKDWAVEEIINAGYGLATIYYGDLQPDSADSFSAGAGALITKNKTDNDGANPGAIAIWAWGLSRALDYLETDKAVDAKKVAVIGHSRLGKTALWAGAQDKRFAMVISNNSGEGGAAITRRKYGETIAIMNKAFPHWFCSNFKKYNDREDELPVDFHELIALIAPRPVYIASASDDQWADPEGEYLSGYYATPVYNLYGLQGLTSNKQPGINTPVGNGSIGYHMRQGEHALRLYDWQQYIRFADRFLKPL